MKVKTNNSKGNEREAISRQDSFKICRKQEMDEILAQMGAMHRTIKQKRTSTLPYKLFTGPDINVKGNEELEGTWS